VQKYQQRRIWFFAADPAAFEADGGAIDGDGDLLQKRSVR
jgi:hypothetical protein